MNEHPTVIVRHSHGTYTPAINVKVTMGIDSVSLPIELSRSVAADGEQIYVTDPGFTTEWLREFGDENIQSWWDLACQDNFEVSSQRASEMLGDAFPSSTIKCYSDGRSGGWLTVDGLPEVEDWTPEQFAAWQEFAEDTRAVADDVPRATLVSIYMNVYEPQIEAEQEQARKVELGTDEHLVNLTSNEIRYLARAVDLGRSDDEARQILSPTDRDDLLRKLGGRR